MEPAKNVDDYIASQPPELRKRLKIIRKIINKIAPKAEERLSYGMPYYKLNGRLLYYGAHQNHIGIYPMKSAINHFQKELSTYHTGPGSVQLPLNEPLPEDLIKRIIEFRVKENLAKAK